MSNFLVIKDTNVGIKDLKTHGDALWPLMQLVSLFDPNPVTIETEKGNIEYRNNINVKTLVIKFKEVSSFEKNQDNIDILDLMTKTSVSTAAKSPLSFYAAAMARATAGQDRRIILPCYDIKLKDAEIFYINACGEYISLNSAFKNQPTFEEMDLSILLDAIDVYKKKHHDVIKFYEDVTDESI